MPLTNFAKPNLPLFGLRTFELRPNVTVFSNRLQPCFHTTCLIHAGKQFGGRGKFIRMLKEIWREITFGVGTWGALRPIFAVLLSIIPFLYLGQHFNREHRRGIDWLLLQIPLALTIVLWIGLYLWSIFDAWRDAIAFKSQIQDQS